MTDTSELIGDLADQAEYSGDWRREKAEEYPDDERNAEAAGSDTVIVRFENCGHGEARFKQPSEYTEAIRKFVLESVMGSGDGSRP
ncbi:MAG: hypothetical protein IH944_13980 [Armatimonadetes bacterium]|nr:hypothetical protein [Armatimonadota bacterium]